MISVKNVFYNNINANIKSLYASLEKIAGRSHSEDEESSSHWSDPNYPNYSKEKLDQSTEGFDINDPEIEQVAEGDVIPDTAFKYEKDRNSRRYKDLSAFITMMQNDAKLNKIKENNPAKYKQIVDHYKQKFQTARNFNQLYKKFLREMAGIDATVNPKLGPEVSEKFKKIKKIRDMENERNPGTYEEMNLDLKPFTYKKDIGNTEEILYKKKIVLDKIDSLLERVEIYREKVNPAYKENATSLAMDAFEEIEKVYNKISRYRKLFTHELSQIDRININNSEERTVMVENLTESTEELLVELDKISRYVDQISSDIDAYDYSYEDLKELATTNKFIEGYISKYVSKSENISELATTTYKRNFGTEFFTNAYSAAVDSDPRVGSDEYFGYDGLDISNEEAVMKYFTEGAPEKKVDPDKEDIVTFKCIIPYQSIDWELMDKNYKDMGDYENDPLMHVIYVKPGAKIAIHSAFYNDRDVEMDNVSLGKAVVTANKLPEYVDFIRMAYTKIPIYHNIESDIRVANEFNDVAPATVEQKEESYSVDFWQERDRVSVVVNNNLTGETIFESWDEDVVNDIDLGLYEFGDAESVLDYLRSVGMIK